MDDSPVLNKVDMIEDIIAEMPQADMNVNHYFSDGLYTRELFIPKDCVLTGHAHKKACMNFLMKGSILVNDGDKSYHVVAPSIIHSCAGSRKTGIAIEDCIWVTTHATDAKTVADAELELVEPMRESVRLKLENNKCLSQ